MLAGAEVRPCNGGRGDGIRKQRDAVNIGADGVELVDDGDPRDQIARLEAQLERLDEALARCRKVKLIAQIAFAGGAIWMAAALVGVIGVDPVAMVAAISVVIGGAVMYGSNTTTTQEVSAAIADAEAERAELIESLDLEAVNGSGGSGRRMG
jgi:hypothetical protein